MSDYSESLYLLFAYIPDAPVNLKKESSSDEKSITFSWVEGLSNGGSEIVSYNVFQENLNFEFVEVASVTKT